MATDVARGGKIPAYLTSPVSKLDTLDYD